MQNLKTKLKNKLKNAKRIALLGVGSELRADDISGMLVAEQLQKKFEKENGKNFFKIFLGGTAPENFTGEIKKYKPTHLIIVDSADAKQKPGEIMFPKPEEIAGMSFSTHTLPLSILVDYILESIMCKIVIIGIQPKILDFGKSPSKEVKNSVKSVSDAIQKAVQNMI